MIESGSTVLVTGCRGFIGKHLVGSLLQIKGTTVYGVDMPSKFNENFIEENRGSLSKFVTLPTDLTEESNCGELPDVDYVFHLAAINGTQLFYQVPWHVFYNSSVSTINLINRYKECETLKRFVYASSSEVYADLSAIENFTSITNESVAVGFQDVFNPRWSYGGAKLTGEIGVVAAGQQFDFPFTILRYHNVYGASMGINHVMPDFIDRGKLGTYELYGGDNVRSFIYVSDAVEATLISAYSNEAEKRIVHIGTMEPITMLEMARKIMRLSNWSGEIKVNPAPSGSTSFRCPDTSFLNQVLGFSPRVTLELGLKLLLADRGVL